MRTLCHLVLVAGAACLWSASAVAQTKFSATDTCAKDRGDPAHYPATDMDGQARPIGAAPDVGADESG